MKKNYFEPSINVQAFEMENILTASGATVAGEVDLANLPEGVQPQEISFKNFNVVF